MIKTLIFCCFTFLGCMKPDYESAGVRPPSTEECDQTVFTGWWKYIGPYHDLLGQYDPHNYIPIHCMREIQCPGGTDFICAIKAPGHYPEGNIPDMQGITEYRYKDQ